MALVFKIKFNDILRRWLVPEDCSAMAFSLTFSQLEDKIRELFHLSHAASLVITYVDKENDVVTLGDDQDLVDACLVQQLNPLHLDVHVKESAAQEAAAEPSSSSSEVGNMDMILKRLLPQAAADNLKNLEAAAIPSSSSSEVGNMDMILKRLLPKATADNLKNLVKASTQILDAKHLAGILGGNSKKGLQVGSDMTAVVPPQIPVLPNLRAFGAYHVFHSGVQCDGCGMNPIEGPRYKSTKVPNYDLCFGCYDRMGTEADFEKIEHPLNSHGGSFFFDRTSRCPAGPACRPSFAHAWMPECPFSGQAMDLSLFDSRHKKLDAKFVKDVTVFDGTELGPGMKFTKVWCMANNGTLPWPQGTQLVKVESNALSSTEVVNVELPEGGLPCGEEVEISVNLTAPDTVGRYVSHWRLLSPSGRKFGHRVWVMIQVINTSIKEEETFVNIEVNHGQDTKEAIVEKGTFSAPSKLNSEEGSLTYVAEMHENGDGVLSDQGDQPVLDTEMDIELDGFSVVEKPVDSTQSEIHSSPTEKEMTEIDVETQLKVLESLGFDNRELSLYWLKQNSGSMQGALENLTACAGWEQKIRNLEDLGFDDQPTNIHLLHKHNGSIKLVVKDLVKMENQKEG